MTSTRRWLRFIVVVIIVMFVGVFVNHTFQKNTESARPNLTPAIPVVTAVARKGDLPFYLTGLGSVTAFNTVTVRTRVDGELMRVAVQEGQMVSVGDLIAEIDPRPFQVQLMQAEGQSERDQAILENAKVDLERYRVLYSEDSIPKQQLDTQVATVNQNQAVLKADQAAIDNAKLQLTYTRITSPIMGRIGLRQVDPGNIVHASDQNGIAVITQLQPIAVIFSIPQDNVSLVLKKLLADERLQVTAYDRDIKNKLATGSLLTIDNQADVTTGTVRFKAVFTNNDNALFPNQFVNARVLVNVRHGVVLVPAAAIQRGPQDSFVFVVTKDNTVQARTVTVGPTEGDVTAIEHGLSAGETVVTQGVDKLQDGARVTTQPE